MVVESWPLCLTIPTRRALQMNIGEPLRTIIVEPIELPVDEPAVEPELEPEPSGPESEPEPARR
jgi:hypothetical protein